MKIALFGRDISPAFAPSLQKLIQILEPKTSHFLVYDHFYPAIASLVRFSKEVKLFHKASELDKDAFCLISIGGDGTLLDTITLLQDKGIPVLGINTGRLGFLSAVSDHEVAEAAEALITGNFSIDKRSLVQLMSPDNLFSQVNYALNELSVLKRDNSSMISISAYVNEQYLNTYWADGLIIATPTGSTGYSLSCGGPIITPESKNFVITPIATHNLTVRPIIIPDDNTIKLKISGRTQEFLVALDSRSRQLSTSVELIIKRAPFFINLICIGSKDFYKTIRNKLAWGFDKRN